MIAVDNYCSSIPVGEGRVLNCLEENDKQVSECCEQAINFIGIEKLGKPEIFSSSRLKTKSPVHYNETGLQYQLCFPAI
jgi:hypothetical protein